MDLKKIVTIVVLCVLAWPVAAKSSYQSILKKWTRTDKIYVIDNFEARLIWNATYLSSDFRAARREKLSDLLEWSNEELAKKAGEDADESSEFDVFFVSIYAGSAAFPEIGKDTSLWRIFLDHDSGPGVAAAEMERLPLTQIERELYPYLDKWSHIYYIRFPKTLRSGESFRLRMAGIPAKSELVWK